MNSLTDDMIELLDLLNKHKVDFLVCGGHAVAFYGYIRMTMDFDLLIVPNEENAIKTVAALNDFGFGNAGIPLAAFLKKGTAITIGQSPNQVDLLTSMNSTDPQEILTRAVDGTIDDIPVKFVSLKDLLQAKHEANRLKDQLDIEELTKINKLDQ